MPTLPDGMPRSMQRLPLDDAGRPVPKFVEWLNGKPDFRVMNPQHYRNCIQRRVCWVCGDKLASSQIRRNEIEVLRGEHVFVAGPMCLVNGTSGEPPCHPDCASWSARACPFLSNPNKVRRTAGLPDNVSLIEDTVGGIAIARNPGVSAVIAVNRWWVQPVPNGAVIRFPGHVTRVEWVAHGRDATSEEVLASIESGLPVLQEAAAEDGIGAQRELARLVQAALEWVPDGSAPAGSSPQSAGVPI